MGFVGTWVGQASIGGIGLLRTGVCALLLQASSLALAAVIYRYRLVTSPGLHPYRKHRIACFALSMHCLLSQP